MKSCLFAIVEKHKSMNDLRWSEWLEKRSCGLGVPAVLTGGSSELFVVPPTSSQAGRRTCDKCLFPSSPLWPVKKNLYIKLSQLISFYLNFILFSLNSIPTFFNFIHFLQLSKKMNLNIRKKYWWNISYTIRLHDETNNANSFVALSHYAQLLYQNNASSSIIHMRNSIHRDRIEARQLLIRHYLVTMGIQQWFQKEWPYNFIVYFFVCFYFFFCTSVFNLKNVMFYLIFHFLIKLN